MLGINAKLISMRFPLLKTVLGQLFSLKVLWVAVVLHVAALVFIFHHGFVVLIYLVLICFSLYSFLAALLLLFQQKNTDLGGAYMLAAVLIITTTLPPISSELERFRYWLRFVSDQQKYESEVARLAAGEDGFRRGRWDWGPDPDGGGIELAYDGSDKLSTPPAVNSSFSCVELLPVHITGHFYFIRTVCPGVI